MMRACIIRFVATGIIALMALYTGAQRVYTNNSVLGSGNWYKISVNAPGVYKIDIPFLNSLGINTGSISSSSIRLYGNGGQMVPENTSGIKWDDLYENAIWVEDGGDGILNGSDYILFYAPGPQGWIKDSVARTFHHQKNVYTDVSWYYLSIGGTGKRIPASAPPPSSNVTITDFTYEYFYELDTVNLLSSGRQWYGEEFSDAPGKVLTRTFNIPVT